MRLSHCCLILAIILATVACDEGPAPDATGEEIFMQICATCHSSDLSGGVGPALGPGSNAAEQPDEFLVMTITEGRGRMPSFSQTLSPEQITRVVEYIRAVQSGP